MTVWSLSALSAAVKTQGRYGEAHLLTQRAVALAFDPRNDESRLWYPHFFLGMTLADADRLDEAKDAYARALEEAEELGSAWLLPDMLMLAGELRFLVGDWDDATAELEPGLLLAAKHGQRVCVNQSRAYQAVVATARTDLAAANAALSSVADQLNADAPWYGAEMVAFAAALVAALVLDFTQSGWWVGHGLELAGIGFVGGAVALDLYRSVQSRPLVGDLRGSELVSEEEAFLGSQIRALTVRLADKDTYTEEHTRRVALRAVQVGEELGLPPGRLRTLAVGGLLHDIGKLSVPDEILKKPGSLEPGEYAVIQRHPEHGKSLLRELGGFAEGVLRLVHDHHERLDGTGYPRGLREAELDLDTRILAVCDVYDALISTRVYRAAWSADKALSLLFEQAGAAFDKRCVEALARVLARVPASPLREAV